MNAQLLAALAAVPVVLAITAAPPASAVATTCGVTNEGGGSGAAVCEYLAATPVGTLKVSGAVSVIVRCTAGGTSSPGLYPQAGFCYALATFAGPGSFEAGGLPI